MHCFTRNQMMGRLLLGLALVCVSWVSAAKPVSFVNDVVPILTKAGCNAGECHAKAGMGQNGFQLSLLGFEPQEDYEHLVKEARSRRILPTAPDHSLLLMKASASVPHGGGNKLPKDSEGYRIIRDWISQGLPGGAKDEPQIQSIDVTPARETLKKGAKRQLKVIARYSDNSSRDVTQLALYEPNDRAMAEVTGKGLVHVSDLPGKVAIMVRYAGLASVCNVSVPLGAPVEKLPPQSNFIDELVFANLKLLGIPPSEVIDDTAFLRRVTLDIGGRMPTLKETEAFLADENPKKREVLIDALLQSPDYADYFANKWTSLLKNRRDSTADITANFAFFSWVRDGLLANKAYDQMVRELLAATGTILGNPPVAWYKRVKDPKTQIEDVAQLFLGVRMQCAQCHHHPFERWSQDDYYSLTAFFSQIGRKPTGIQGEDMIYHKRGIAQAKNAKSGVSLRPAALGTKIADIPPDDDPRLQLASWMSDPKNPFFAKALVNRYWKHFFKRGLIEPEDDIRDTNPPTNPELLTALEKYFVDKKFDLKALVRIIANSTTYQLSSKPNKHNLGDWQNFSRFQPRRLQAEVLLDSIDQLTGATTSFADLPAGTRAVALPDNSYNKSSAFLRVFGRPDGTSVCECERVESSSLSQSLHLMNGSDIKTKLKTSNGRAHKFSTDKRENKAKIQELYLAAFSRTPAENELHIALDYLEEPLSDAKGNLIKGPSAERQKFEDLIWALMNTKEFLFNH
ncbi:MAG: S-layer protein [Verrucomicrobiales bacterium]|nr:S-layer protein [Verrucomicrobiales bacterium]